MTLSRDDNRAVSTHGITPARAGRTENHDGKHHQLNRFLSKTFHMVNTCDRSIVSWAKTGDSFIVFDVEGFSERVLPQYFKHSKFSSFVRQLNFYSFRKIRANCDPMNQQADEGMGADSVRFYHQYFQPNRPDLLHKIIRTTKASEFNNDPGQVVIIESLQHEIDTLKERLENVEDRMDAKIEKFKQQSLLLENDYQRRIVNLEKAYHEMIMSVLSSPSTSLSLVHPPGLSSQQSLLGARPPLTRPLLVALSSARSRGNVSPLFETTGSNCNGKLNSTQEAYHHS